MSNLCVYEVLEYLAHGLQNVTEDRPRFLEDTTPKVRTLDNAA